VYIYTYTYIIIIIIIIFFFGWLQRWRSKLIERDVTTSNANRAAQQQSVGNAPGVKHDEENPASGGVTGLPVSDDEDDDNQDGLPASAAANASAAEAATGLPVSDDKGNDGGPASKMSIAPSFAGMKRKKPTQMQKNQQPVKKRKISTTLLADDNDEDQEVDEYEADFVVPDDEEEEEIDDEEDAENESDEEDNAAEGVLASGKRVLRTELQGRSAPKVDGGLPGGAPPELNDSIDAAGVQQADQEDDELEENAEAAGKENKDEGVEEPLGPKDDDEEGDLEPQPANNILAQLVRRQKRARKDRTQCQLKKGVCSLNGSDYFFATADVDLFWR
jgi:hypothetical protein